MLTKGDNNHVDDLALYEGLDWLERKHIVGKVRGRVHFTSTINQRRSHSYPFSGLCRTLAMSR